MGPEGLALLKRHEQCRLIGYLPTAHDVPTIGWGHTGIGVTVGEVITQEAADQMLAVDVQWADTCVAETCPVATTGQADAMTDLAFNIGATGFKSSSVARLHNAGRFPEAGQAFALWNKQKGVVLMELVRRRAEETAMYIEASPAPAPEERIDVAPGAAEGEKPLAQSRTINGQVIAGAATAGGGLIATVQDHPTAIEQAQAAIAPLAGFYSWAAVACALIALAGIGWGIYARYSDRETGRS